MLRAFQGLVGLAGVSLSVEYVLSVSEVPQTSDVQVDVNK